jgi:hypothetical protein
MVDGVMRERLHKRRCLRTDGWRQGRASNPAKADRGKNIIVEYYYSSLLLASVEARQKESYGGKKRFFPGRVGNIPGEAGKTHIENAGQLYWAM